MEILINSQVQNHSGHPAFPVLQTGFELIEIQFHTGFIEDEEGAVLPVKTSVIP